MARDIVDIAIIGAGFAGIAAAHHVRASGFTDIAILERGADVGGVWRENTYPGCACDVPSRLYSLSFGPELRWSRRYAPQREIWDYLRRAVDDLGLRQSLHLGCEVHDASWDGTGWTLATSQGPMRARVLIGAQGALSEPATPDVPGLDTFEGNVFHTAAWRHDIDLTGVRVGVVGSGASAIQVVPAIQPLVARLVVFQRTPPWVLPRSDRALSPRERRLASRRIPEQMSRGVTYATLESRAVGFVKEPRLMALGERQARRFLRQEVADPDLREALTPRHRMGCRRTLLSDDWYRALVQPNVDVVSAGVTGVQGSTVTASDGSVHDVDALILASGFRVFGTRSADAIRGVHGGSLAEAYGDSPRAYKGTTVAGFPNYFQMLGPNTGLGHTSMIYMLESQARYIADGLRGMRAHGIRAVEVRPDAQAAWNSELDTRLAGSVWADAGCGGWYHDRSGRPTAIWPGFTFEFRQATRRFDPEAYRAVG